MENLSSTLLKKQENFALPSLVRFAHARELGLTGRAGYKRNAALRYAEARAAMPVSNLTCEVSTSTKSTFVITFSPDGCLVASSHGDHSVRVSELRSGKCLHTLVGHPRTPWTLAFHPSSSDILASGCLAGDVRIWDLKGGGSELWKVPGRTVIASLTFHPTDQVLVIATANIIYFWDWSHQEPFASTKSANEYEKVRWVKFDCWGHYLYTGIANGSTIQRDDPLDASSFSENFWAGDTVGDVMRERHRLRQQYRTILTRFNHTPSPAGLPVGFPPTAPYTRPSTSGDLELDPVLNHDLPDILNPPEMSPGPRGALEEARLYAARVTRDIQRSVPRHAGSVRRRVVAGAERERLTRSGVFRTSSSGQMYAVESDEDDVDTDEDLSRLSSSSRGNRNERTPLEQDFRNFRVRSLAEESLAHDEEGNGTSMGGPGSSFVPYTTHADTLLGLARPRLSFSQFGSLLDARRASTRREGTVSTTSSGTAPTSMTSSGAAPTDVTSSRVASTSMTSSRAASTSMTSPGATSTSMTSSGATPTHLTSSRVALPSMTSPGAAQTSMTSLGAASTSMTSSGAASTSMTSSGASSTSMMSSKAASTSMTSSGAAPTRVTSSLVARASVTSSVVARTNVTSSVAARIGVTSSVAARTGVTSSATGRTRVTSSGAASTSMSHGVVGSSSDQETWTADSTQAQSSHANVTDSSAAALVAEIDSTTTYRPAEPAVASSVDRVRAVRVSRSDDVILGADSTVTVETGNCDSNLAETGVTSSNTEMESGVSSSEETVTVSSYGTARDRAGASSTGLDASPTSTIPAGAVRELNPNTRDVPSSTSREDIPSLLSRPTSSVLSHPTSSVLSHPTSSVLSQPTSSILPQPVSVILSQPTSSIVSQPTSSLLSQPLSDMLSQPISSSLSQPVSDMLSQPTLSMLSQPLSEISSQPTSSTVSQPVSDMASQPLSDMASQPLSDMASQPVSDMASQPLSDMAAQPLSDMASQPASILYSQSSRLDRVRARLAEYRQRGHEALAPYSIPRGQRERSYEERLAASRRLRESLARMRHNHSGLQRQNAFRLRRGLQPDEPSSRHHECSATNLRDCQCPDQFLARRRRRETDARPEDGQPEVEERRKRPRSESPTVRDQPGSSTRADGRPSTATRSGGQPSTSTRADGQEPARKVRRTDSYCDNNPASSSAQPGSAAAANAPPIEPTTSQSPGTAGARSPSRSDSPTRRSALYGNLSAAASRYLRDPISGDPFWSGGSRSQAPATPSVELEDPLVTNNYERPYNTLLHSLRRRILDLHDQLQRHQRTDGPEVARESNAASSSGGLIDLTSARPFSDSPSTALRTLMAEHHYRTEDRSPDEESRLLDPRLLQRRNAITGERRSFFLDELEAETRTGDRRSPMRSELQQLMDEPVSALRHRPEEMPSRSWRQRISSRPHVIPEITITRPAESPSSMLENTDSDEEVIPEAGGDERSALVRNLNLVRFEAMRFRFLQREREREQWQRDERDRQRERERENQAFERRWSRTWRQLQRRNLHPHYSLDEGFSSSRNPHPHSFYRHVPGAFTGPNDPSLPNSTIVPLTHRIQRWDVRKFIVPDIGQSETSVIVPHCKLHNDSSVELSQDGLLVAAFVPNQGGFPDDSMLCVYSLHTDNLGQCLFSRTFGGPNAVCVSISPRSERILVGLAAKRTAWVWPPNHLVAQVFSLRSKESSADLTMRHVYDVVHPCASDLRTQHVSVNSAKWLPGEGRGLIYGTNRGHLIMKTPGVEGKKVSRRGDPDHDLDVQAGAQVYAPTPLRRNIMEMLGLAPRTTSTSTQTSDEAQSAPSWRLRAITVDNQQPRAGPSAQNEESSA